MEKNGLEIGLEEFKKMNSADRDTLLYANIQEIKSRFRDYRVNKKIQYVWLACLTIFIGLKKYIGL